MAKDVHQEYLEKADQEHAHLLARRQQWVRFLVILLIISVWLSQTLYVTWRAVNEPDILTDIEKFILLIGVTGGVAAVLILKLWPENGRDK